MLLLYYHNTIVVKPFTKVHMLNAKGYFIFFIIIVLIRYVSLFAEEREVLMLDEIMITGEKVTTPTKQTGDAVYTGTEITKKGIELSGEKGKSNVYEAISILPGIIYESSDANNLSAEQSNIRIRGVNGALGAMTVEGIPNYGGNPMGPRAYIYDLENFESIAVYKGAIPADLGSGVGNRGGAIELRPKWAAEDFRFITSQSLGSYEYKKTFLRLDTGEIGPIDSLLSLSYSFAAEDKWKGPGDVCPRHNINFSYVQSIGEKIEVKFWGNFNKLKYNNYRSLNYEQAKNIDEYYRLDFNDSIVGDSLKDYLYYKFNKSYHKNRDYFSIITIKPIDKVKLTIKPYFSKEDADLWDGSPYIQGSPGVQRRTRDIERKGIISEIILNLHNFSATAGYLYESSIMNINSHNLRIYEDGALKNIDYGIFTPSKRNYFHSPYVKIGGIIDKFSWQAGIKYFRFKDAGSDGYIKQFSNENPITIRSTDLDRRGRIYDLWLPSAGISYTFNENIEAYINYGKNFIRPYAYMPLTSLYNRLRPQFQIAGITLDDLFQGYDIEKSDSIELGLRLLSDYIEVNPTVFFSKHKNLLTTVADPRITDPSTESPVNYYQNIGKAISYGFEMGTNLFISDWLTAFINPTFNHFNYDGDMAYQGKTMPTDGKQVVDVPKWTLTSGLILKYKDFELIPIMRYVGKRYGDVEHKEKISSHTVVDLKFSYIKEKKKLFEGLKISLEFDNIFNNNYISTIEAMDSNVSGSTYYVGAPFTVKGSISFLF